MSDNQQHMPFKTLGVQLKSLRERSKESVAEVSGAVEIDEAELNRIEAGLARPAEDILLLLISHFAMPESEATQLWQLAGYDGIPETIRLSAEEEVTATAHKAVVMFLALESRTLYSDAVTVEPTTSGITIDFKQGSGPNGQQASVSRVGMSHAQAVKVMQELQTALLKAKYLNGPKQLPPSTDKV